MFPSENHALIHKRKKQTFISNIKNNPKYITYLLKKIGFDKWSCGHSAFLDSERSNEFFGFTIICCFLFLSHGTFEASLFFIQY